MSSTGQVQFPVHVFISLNWEHIWTFMYVFILLCDYINNIETYTHPYYICVLCAFLLLYNIEKYCAQSRKYTKV